MLYRLLYVDYITIIFDLLINYWQYVLQFYIIWKPITFSNIYHNIFPKFYFNQVTIKFVTEYRSWYWWYLINHRDRLLTINDTYLKAQRTSRMDKILTALITLYVYVCRRYLESLRVSRIVSVVKVWCSSKPVCHLHPSNHHSSTKDPSLFWQPSAQHVSSPCQGRTPSYPVPASHHAPRRRVAATSTLSKLRTACKCTSNLSVVLYSYHLHFSTFLDSSLHITILHNSFRSRFNHWRFTKFLHTIVR